MFIRRCVLPWSSPGSDIQDSEESCVARAGGWIDSYVGISGRCFCSWSSLVFCIVSRHLVELFYSSVGLCQLGKDDHRCEVKFRRFCLAGTGISSYFWRLSWQLVSFCAKLSEHIWWWSYCWLTHLDPVKSFQRTPVCICFSQGLVLLIAKIWFKTVVKNKCFLVLPVSATVLLSKKPYFFFKEKGCWGLSFIVPRNELAECKNLTNTLLLNPFKASMNLLFFKERLEG